MKKHLAIKKAHVYLAQRVNTQMYLSEAVTWMSILHIWSFLYELYYHNMTKIFSLMHVGKTS